jgi:hypothetical protein
MIEKRPLVDHQNMTIINNSEEDNLGDNSNKAEKSHFIPHPELILPPKKKSEYQPKVFPVSYWKGQ